MKRKTKFKTIRGTKTDAQRELTRQLHLLETGEHVDPLKLTVAEYLTDWLKAQTTRISAKTHERYAEIVDKHLAVNLGQIRIQKLTAMQVEEYYAAALSSGRRDGRGGLSLRTVLHHHRVLHAALKKAVRLRLIPRAVTEDVDPPRPRRAEIGVLDGDKMGELIRAAVGSIWYLPIFIAATTGLRRGEILGLRWRDVDLSNRGLHVTQVVSETKGRLQFKDPKTARGRRPVTLPGVTIEAIRGYRASQAQLWLATGIGRDEDALLFSNVEGDVLLPSSMTKAVKYFMAEIGVPWASLKTLRHSHATQLLKSGIHPKVASERLGHSSVSITLDIYSHVTPSMQEDAATAIDAAMRPALERKDDKA